MRYLSVCSGIEAASVAWGPLGWTAAAFAEIAAFPSSVLAHRFPSVPNLGSIEDIREDSLDGPIDLLVGGTPCQGFSVAGPRTGLDDSRSCLALEFARLARQFAPAWLVWENVPGCLSTSGGRDFGAFLGALAQIGYSLAYRVLDAQHFGVPHRRRRVFLVGNLGADWRRPFATLFERAGLSGDSPESSPARPPSGASVRAFIKAPGRIIANCLTCGYARQPDNSSRTSGPPNVLVDQGRPRRFTPIECERLMGFPDDWTRVPHRGKPAEQCPILPRYEALGNSMAVPVMRWIGERIQAVEDLGREEAA